jgi:hypothetical protein
LPSTRRRRQRAAKTEFCAGQLAFLAGDWNTDLKEIGLMQFNRLCWLTSHCDDPNAKLRDGSPGPNELRRLARAAGLTVYEDADGWNAPTPRPATGGLRDAMGVAD